MTAQHPPPAFVHHTASPHLSAPVLFTVPHSGRYYPQDMVQRSDLTETQLCQSEDAFVDQLFSSVPKLGANMLVATHARAYLDLNRAANELDADMFTPPLARRDIAHTHRVEAGLGVIPRIISEKLPIYTQALPARDVEKRLSALYYPYHDKVRSILKSIRDKHGYTILIDCHSMPSTGAGKGTSKVRGSKTGPDIILGDCWGKSCGLGLTGIMERLFLEAGFSVKRNVPYSGGFITSEYGMPSSNIHALQVEINRSVYMNEKTQQPLSDFQDVQKAIQSVCKQLTSYLVSEKQTIAKMQQPLAAE